MSRFAALAVALLLLLPGLALAQEKGKDATPEQTARIDAALKAEGCEGGDIEVEKDGGFEVDDVKCKDGQYDIKLDKDFKITAKKKE